MYLRTAPRTRLELDACLRDMGMLSEVGEAATTWGLRPPGVGSGATLAEYRRMALAPGARLIEAAPSKGRSLSRPERKAGAHRFTVASGWSLGDLRPRMGCLCLQDEPLGPLAVSGSGGGCSKEAASTSPEACRRWHLHMSAVQLGGPGISAGCQGQNNFGLYNTLKLHMKFSHAAPVPPKHLVQKKPPASSAKPMQQAKVRFGFKAEKKSKEPVREWNMPVAGHAFGCWLFGPKAPSERQQPRDDAADDANSVSSGLDEPYEPAPTPEPCECCPICRSTASLHEPFS